MSIPVADFWKLAVRSQAISLDEANTLHAAFVSTPGAAKYANAATVAEWLIAGGVLSRYQARQLLTGKPASFIYRDYKVIDRIATGALAGLYRAVHVSSGQPAMLFFCESTGGTSQDRKMARQQAEFQLMSRYPQAGKVLGMFEAERQWFLVLEDVADEVQPAAANAPKTQAESSISATPAWGSSRPAPAWPGAALKKEAPRFDSESCAPGPQDDYLSIADMPTTISREKPTSVSFLWYGGAICLALVGLALLLRFGGSRPTGTMPAETTTAQPSGDQRMPPPESVLTPEPSLIKPNASAQPTRSVTQPVNPDEPPASATVEIADDGQSMWTSPTHGPPLDLPYLASGAQMFLVVHPSAILGTEEGEKVFAALGPIGVAGEEFVRTATGIDELANVERLMVALYPVDGAPPQIAMVVTLHDAKPRGQLLRAWRHPKAVSKPKPFYQGAPWAYYVPTEAGGRVIAVAPPGLMAEMLGMEEPPPLRREMEKLLRDTDDTRHVTLLLAPNFLFTDGEVILSGNMAKLKDPLLAFLGEGVLAAELSFHLSRDNCFGEMRVCGALDTSPYMLAETYRTRLGELPSAVEEYLAKLNPQQYGRLVLARMPRMIGELAAYTRIADENKHALLRCYLPAAAAHNLTLATVLALSERPGSAGSTLVDTGPKKPATVAEALKQKITLSFPRNTLEKCIELFGEEIDVAVHIEGQDLQSEGITKNQSFGLDERNKPADEILRKVMQLANPDGKLVYVVKPLAPGGQDVVFITTRAAVAKRGDKLPPGLEHPPSTK